MSKRGKNGKETKKVPIPKIITRTKPQGLVAQILADQKKGLGLSTIRKKGEEPFRVAKLHLMYK